MDDAKPPLDAPLIGLLSLVGVAMGLLVSWGLTGDSIPGEFFAWSAFAVLWVGVVLMRHTPRPFLTILLASSIGGVLFGATVQALWPSYVANNVASFTEPARQAGQDVHSALMRATNFGFAIVTGIVWGALVGGIAALIARMRRPRRA